MVTSNLGEFGLRELKEASELLQVLKTNKDKTIFFEMTGVNVTFNRNSGWVFLANDEWQAAMLNKNGELEDLIYCPECGNEDLLSEFDYSKDCCREFYCNIMDMTEYQLKLKERTKGTLLEGKY